MTFALILFAGMYVCLLALPDYRYITALVTACIFVVTGILPVSKVFFAVDWNIILMLSGIMIVVELFIESNMSMRMAEKLLKIVPNVKWAVVALSLFAGVVSAFVDNVATVLMVAPIGLEVCRKLDTTSTGYYFYCGIIVTRRVQQHLLEIRQVFFRRCSKYEF